MTTFLLYCCHFRVGTVALVIATNCFMGEKHSIAFWYSIAIITIVLLPHSVTPRK